MKHEFRLAQLLRYRKSIEDQLRISLALIKEKRYEQEEKLSQLRETQRAYLNLGSPSTRIPISGRPVPALHLSCLDALSQESFSRRKTLQELQRRALKVREELLEASRSREIVERLRDRQFERYKQYILQQERKYLDEIAASQFVRKR
jgi:flagellar export protein FliJ